MRPRVKSVMAVLMLLISSVTVHSAEVLTTFDTPEQSALYQRLLKEYRCLKCQNQNLSDSNAGLAGDLRREIRDQIQAGKEKKDIDEYLVARYGEFVLYRPRFSAKTAVLWIAPFVFLVVAITSLVFLTRKRSLRNRQDAGASSVYDTDQTLQERLEKARELLKD